ncbi:D-2-hydroxyacid dehydrogenase [Schinkia azotoformans]|uniref:D-3-phosphoglycerate dehydrogenase n=1 Tax=Schinkia azotoformans LMG 9581 TaxID=1131731 RepID=K6D5S8_SCHAZ|nr:D-2-hydroxyacid dehydrogenase [Schinkia azotoformans]EKN63644.1 D-3-phosphoglycerate dehydrogenase [Schinkia azotoformans LMG 9581]MEC1639900.1 D-2-hydroxyacid dehydrogenase [Schinkia azotoformans]MEC1947297.1 D-2-hydroxyacid dehydrogenase [Schinkia azotoformans]
MKIVTSFNVNPKIQNELMEKFPNIEFSFHKVMKEAVSEIDSAEILVSYGGDLNEEVINKAANLKWIMVFSAGIEKLPFETIKQKGILVTNARGTSKIPMAEYTMGMILQVARKTKQLIENEKQEEWNRRLKMIEISGATITIMGTGSIGSEIARLARAFGMKTVGINRSGRSVEYFDEVYPVTEMDKAIEQGDYIVSVLPSTPDTYHLLKEQHFKIMKNDCLFMNIGRASLVDENVLMKALETDEIAHAVLDVFETEPLPKGHPFWQMENVTITPHLSGVSRQYLLRCIEIFEHNLKQYLSGENNLINVIDLDRGY